MNFGLVGSTLSTLPSFAAYMAVALVMMALFMLVYTAITPHQELALIREGNFTAALSLGGALIGFALPLASVIAHTHLLLDVVVWGIVALLVQLFVWALSNLLCRNLSERVKRNEAASGLFLASTSIAGGIINAACMTY